MSVPPPGEPRALLVDDARSLAALLETLGRAALLALDVESNGMHAYRADLCVMQLCVAHPERPATEVFVVDTLALEDLSAIGSALDRSGAPVVMHDVSFDVRLLSQRGIRLREVVDTSVHARFLSLPETGLGSLLRSRFGVVLDKSFQQHDWALRPFSERQLSYLCADVAYLGPLATQLRGLASEAGIAAEIVEETAYATALAERDTSLSTPWDELKGVGALDRVQKSVLERLYRERDHIAQTLDVPPGRVISNVELVSLAKARPATVRELRQAARLGPASKNHHEMLLAAIRVGEAMHDPQAADQAPGRTNAPAAQQRAERKRLEKALQVWRAERAKTRGVDPQVVLPGHAVADIVAMRPRNHEALEAIHGFGTTRLERYGEEILAIVAQYGADANA